MRPATNNRKIVAFDEMDIFFKDGVGILLTKSKAIRTVRKGVKLLTSISDLQKDFAQQRASLIFE